MQAFVDESKRQGYLVAAVVCSDADLDTLRRTMRSLLLPGQASVHLRKEGPRRQRQILSTVSRLPARGVVITCKDPDPVDARRRCLRRLVEESVPLGVRRMTIELSDGDLESDERTLYQLLGPRPARRPAFEFTHRRRAAEPALWAADAVAWASARGGEAARTLATLPLSRHRLAP